MDKKLYDGILEILKCYGCEFSHNIDDKVHCYYNEYKQYSVTFDVKKGSINCYGTNDTLFYLKGEHLTLNSLCGGLSNI